jgi:hypothetical protein
VALWLEAHCTNKPLTFLDHHIKCGDSLVGVRDLAVLEKGIPDEAFVAVSADDKATASQLKKRNKKERHTLETGQGQLHFDPTNLLTGLREQRQQLEAIADDSPADVRRKKSLYDDYDRDPQRRKLAEACHLWTAAFFQRLKPGAAPSAITTQVITDHLADRRHPQAVAIAEALAVQQHFFHWPLEFPEVFGSEVANSEMADSEVAKSETAIRHSPSTIHPSRHSPFADVSGFDVVLSNPPFMGGLKISGNLGDKYRHWLEVAFAPYGGTADLCAAFYRRTFQLLRPGSRMGLVSTNTLGQGDTRESGLAVILRQGGRIPFARRFVKWPGDANVEVNLVATHKLAVSREQQAILPVLDGQPVEFISSRLDTDPEAEPARLRQNEGKAFIGDYVRGIGFVLETEEADMLLSKDPRNADCLFPYLNGEDLNSHPEQQPSRWVICFQDWPLERARHYPDLLQIVEQKVKPEREKLRDGVSGYERIKQRWWLYAAYAQGLRRAIAPLERVLLRSRVSELHTMVFVPPGWIYSEQLVVFAFDDDYHFALLQSSVHEVWLRKQASSLRTDVRYTPTDCFDTFPFPPLEYERLASGTWQLEALPSAFQQAAQIGAAYHEHRRQVMLARQLGLTKTYNLFHNPACQDADILRLRELHAAMDRAILDCYGWDDLSPGHDFYQNERGQTRYTVSPAARREVMARLVGLNVEIAGREK